MAPALTRFEAWAVELAVASGGRVVKYIGDEVMFLSPHLEAAAAAVAGSSSNGSRTTRCCARRVPASPTDRCSSRDGDWYGTTVNIAARLVERARPGTVWLTGDGAAELPDAKSRGRRKLRDIPERVELWRIR